MLDGSSSVLAHRLQNVALLVLSLAFLPIDTSILAFAYLLHLVIRDQGGQNRHRACNDANFSRKTILVTGVGMTKGLVLARLFYEAGHDVIGADFESNGALVCGRTSRSLRKFHPLRGPSPNGDSAPYIQSILDIVNKEQIDLWVSCSGVASAVEDGMAKEVVEARTKCKAIQFNVKTTQMLHEKHSFIEHTRSLGLTVPETHEVTSRATVEKILRHAPPGKKYIMKTIGVDDSVRGDMTLLPRTSAVETSKHLARLNISSTSPWILQQFVPGKEYCTHSLVVRGQVKAFVACPSAEMLMHYEALLPESPLSRAMLEFTRTYAADGGAEFTGHLSFDFIVDEKDKNNGRGVELYPIECNPRAHTAVALFNGTPAMVDAYLSVLDYNTRSKGEDEDENVSNSMIVIPTRRDKYYWVGHDLVTNVILPTLSFLTLDQSPSVLLREHYSTFLSRVLSLGWKDGTFEIWDALPWWWLYHVYWPMRFLGCIMRAGKGNGNGHGGGGGGKWSRVNVSTGKMFEC